MFFNPFLDWNAFLIWQLLVMCGATDWTDRSDPSIRPIPARVGGDQSWPSSGVHCRDIPLREVFARYWSIA